MSSISILFAQSALPVELAAPPWQFMGFSVREFAALVGAAIVVVLPIIFWAAYIRKPAGRDHRYRRYGHHHHRHHRRQDSSSSSRENGASSSSTSETGETASRRRRRRSRHRRNPTLAEAGGLPPRRTEASDSLS